MAERAILRGMLASGGAWLDLQVFPAAGVEEFSRLLSAGDGVTHIKGNNGSLVIRRDHWAAFLVEVLPDD